MTVGGSQQLRIFRRAIRDGRSMTDAAIAAGMTIAEARLTANEDLKNPPPPEAFELLATVPEPSAAGDDDMARGERKPKVEQVEQVHAPDFDLAVSIYRKDIKPAASKVGEHAQEMSTAYKEIKKRANIQPQAARLAFRLDDMEESKRDDFLRSFNGLLKRLNIFMPADLVDQAEGKGAAGDNVVPVGGRRRPQLATLPHEGGNEDLVEAAE